MNVNFYENLMRLIKQDPSASYTFLLSEGDSVKDLSADQLYNLSQAIKTMSFDGEMVPNKIVGYLYIKIEPYLYEQVIVHSLCKSTGCGIGDQCLHCNKIIDQSDEEDEEYEAYLDELNTAWDAMWEQHEMCRHGPIMYCDTCISRDN
jgi:hypothetical protein